MDGNRARSDRVAVLEAILTKQFLAIETLFLIRALLAQGAFAFILRIASLIVTWLSGLYGASSKHIERGNLLVYIYNPEGEPFYL